MTTRTGDVKRIPYDWGRVACPTCEQPAEKRCRTLTTGRITDVHMPRVELAARSSRSIWWQRVTDLALAPYRDQLDFREDQS